MKAVYNLIGFINIVIKRLGFDKAILYSSSSSLVSILGNLLTLGLIVKVLTPIEQGYFFTFGSLISVQIFFELGLNGIIVQFIAHESANVITDGKSLIGNNNSISRISSLFKFSLKWYLFFSILLFFTLIFWGKYFFSNFSNIHDSVNWQFPWLLISFSTFLSLIITPFSAFLIGIGEINLALRSQMFQQFIKVLTLILLLFFKFNLYAIGISTILSILPLVYLYFFKRRSYFIFLKNYTIVEKISYNNEILPLQWKIALSWISGYFIFQLFNPILFAREGAIMAGKMGITLSILNAISSISLVWVSTKSQIFSNYIAKKKFKELDVLFNKSILQATFVMVCLFTIFFLIFHCISISDIHIFGKSLSNRFLPNSAILIMSFTILFNLWISAIAIYLRSHKKEPFLILSITSAILCSISITIFGKIFGLYGMIISYLIVTIIITIFAYNIFLRKKNIWHKSLKTI